MNSDNSNSPLPAPVHSSGQSIAQVLHKRDRRIFAVVAAILIIAGLAAWFFLSRKASSLEAAPSAGAGQRTVMTLDDYSYTGDAQTPTNLVYKYTYTADGRTDTCETYLNDAFVLSAPYTVFGEALREVDSEFFTAFVTNESGTVEFRADGMNVYKVYFQAFDNRDNGDTFFVSDSGSVVYTQDGATNSAAVRMSAESAIVPYLFYPTLSAMKDAGYFDNVSEELAEVNKQMEEAQKNFGAWMTLTTNAISSDSLTVTMRNLSGKPTLALDTFLGHTREIEYSDSGDVAKITNKGVDGYVYSESVYADGRLVKQTTYIPQDNKLMLDSTTTREYEVIPVSHEVEAAIQQEAELEALAQSASEAFYSAVKNADNEALLAAAIPFAMQSAAKDVYPDYIFNNADLKAATSDLDGLADAAAYAAFVHKTDADELREALAAVAEIAGKSANSAAVESMLKDVTEVYCAPTLILPDKFDEVDGYGFFDEPGYAVRNYIVKIGDEWHYLMGSLPA